MARLYRAGRDDDNREIPTAWIVPAVFGDF
jgi:hypothetical protein